MMAAGWASAAAVAGSLARALALAAAYYAALTRLPLDVGAWCRGGSFAVDCHSPEGLAAQSTNRTAIRVILPSAGQTGTTSVIMALRELGMRAWHADDFSIYAKKAMIDEFRPREWIQFASRCRMEAISLEPIMDLFPLVLHTSSQAKVVMTWRSYHSWLKSMRDNHLRENRLGYIIVPLYHFGLVSHWVEAWDAITGQIERVRREAHPFFGRGISISALLYRAVCNGYAWPKNNLKQRGTRKIRAQEEAYLAQMNEVRMHTPAHRLLEFDVRRHGWDEFARFLGVPAPPAGTPFPHPRSKHARTNEPVFENHPLTGGTVWFLLAAMHAANFFLMAAALQALWAAARMAAAHAATRTPATPDTKQRLEQALVACPVVTVLQGVQPAEAVQAGRTLAEAGVRIIEVPLSSPGALKIIGRLVEALPSSVLVGAGTVVTKEEVRAVARAGGALVASPHLDGDLVRCARRRGLLSLPGVCTPSEALAAVQQGADALQVFPAEEVPAVALGSWGPPLLRGVPVLIAWVGAPRDMSAYWAAGAKGVRVSNGLLSPGEATPAVRTRLEALLAARPPGPAAGVARVPD